MAQMSACSTAICLSKRTRHSFCCQVDQGLPTTELHIVRAIIAQRVVKLFQSIAVASLAEDVLLAQVGVEGHCPEALAPGKSG